MLKRMTLLTLLALIGFGVLAFGAPNIRVAGVGANEGNACAQQIAASGDFPGTFTFLSDTDTFNGMSPAQLRANYDVLLFTWESDSDINADWATRILPYLALGGGVIFEDPGNIDDLAAVITRGGSRSTSGAVLATVPGLTNGVTASFSNAHMAFSSWDPGFTPFITNPGTGATLGLYGTFSGGRIVVSGPDNHFHGNRCSTGRSLNQYQLLLNEVRWVAGFDTCFQDSTTQSNIVFDPGTGDFVFTSCPDETVTTGHGMAFSSGCLTGFGAGGAGLGIKGFSSSCNNVFTAKFFIFRPPTFVILSTSNPNAGACSCLPLPAPDAYCLSFSPPE
ncbi:MAG: hypothetical protein PHX83_10145 [Acidobacteriia bacterium]|nr:hypothetical protein [Terriglobia bacterium]